MMSPQCAAFHAACNVPQSLLAPASPTRVPLRAHPPPDGLTQMFAVALVPPLVGAEEVTTPVTEESADTEPVPFVAVTTTRTVSPTSAEAST